MSILCVPFIALYLSNGNDNELTELKEVLLLQGIALHYVRPEGEHLFLWRPATYIAFPAPEMGRVGGELCNWRDD